MKTSFLTGALIAAALSGSGAVRAADTPGVPALSVAPPAAHWVERKLDFTYMGFTTHYSCDGLRDNVRDALLALGARRKDLHIQETGCTRLEGAPEPFPGVVAHFFVLVPVTPDDIGKVGATGTQPTQWHTVDLAHQYQFRFDQGQCELLEQLKQKALPLFTTRNLMYHSSCVPHEVTPGDLQFRVDVLKPAATPAPKGAAVDPAA
ncbi:MAG TPA: hypothetical protein VMF03_03985 [Steroidobacteraceae bacterium]|nr:hypothetical protein [Steroidobacteraceae bacterium]